MAAAKAEHGSLFGRLVQSTDPSCPGRILLLRPVFKLQNENLPYPNPLTRLQAIVPTALFLAIIVAMPCDNLLPSRSVESPPIPSLEHRRGTFDLQVAINAMISQHRWLRSHRDTLLDGEHIPAATSENSSRP
ncbi:hypothetical protein EV421DRAFT_1901300 [Armillaria borealis]|uniref:Uncharacterized protein n=1 Tax=Armillaria borealis TaxID=47425 RepID=A0AA39JV71_9AGAR|nr:hypothetical protein EV421DRAFT_1901300 [Armillaria borealis]